VVHSIIDDYDRITVLITYDLLMWL